MQDTAFNDQLQLLTSPDVADRRQAVIGLGNSGEERALQVLAIVYKHDPDPALRDLAFKAGRHIKGGTGPLRGTGPLTANPGQVGAFTLVSPFTTVDSEGELPPAMTLYTRNIAVQYPHNRPAAIPPVYLPPAFSASAPAKLKPVSPQRARLAKGRMESAIGMVARGENDKALALLIEAVQTNPALSTDVLARNLASTLTGLSPLEAIESVTNRALYPPPGKGNIAIAGGVRPSNSIKVDPSLLTLLLMIVALAIILTLFYITLKFGLLNLLTTFGGYLKSDGTQAAEMQQATQTLKALSFGAMARGGLLWTFNILFDTSILYAVGVFMGGSGPVLPFLTRLLRVQAVTYALITLSLAILTFGIYRSIPASAAQQLALFSTVLALLAYLGGSLWKGYSVGLNHNMNFFKGLGVVFVASLVSGMLAVLLGSFS